MNNNDDSVTKASYFPILIEIREDARGLKKGTELVVMDSYLIPTGVSFKVIKTNVEVI